MNLSRAGIAAMLVAAGCSQQPDASKKSPSSTAVPAPSPSLQARADVIEPSPTMSFEAPLPADQTPESIGSTIGRAAAMLVMKTATGIPRLMYWPAGAPAPFFVVELPAGFEWTSIAAHPTKPIYFIGGSGGGNHAMILSVAQNGPRWTVELIHESARPITHLVAAPTPFETDSGRFYRVFYSERLPNGGSSLRSVTERGRLEYQVIGPATEPMTRPLGAETAGAKTAPFAIPLGFTRDGALVWQDERGCVHSFAYDHHWTTDEAVRAVPCGGVTVPTPSGKAFVHWQQGRAGVDVIGMDGASRKDAAATTFQLPPQPIADGKGLIGIAAKGQNQALEFVRVDLP